MSKMNILMKSFLPGFSFGSEGFLFMKLLRDAPGIAWVMVSFRSLHFIMGSLLALSLFAGKRVARKVDLLIGNFVDISDLRDEVDLEFAGKNVPTMLALVVLQLIDVMLIQFMPWKKSTFYVASKGFPTLKTMKTLYAVEVIQSFGAVTSQLIYLVNHESRPSSNNQANALFALSITSTVGGLVVAALFFCLKGQLLEKIQVHTTQVKRNSALLELEWADVYAESFRGGIKNATGDADVGDNESINFHTNEKGELVFNQANPMLASLSTHNPTNATDEVEAKDFRSKGLKISSTDNAVMRKRLEEKNERIECLLMHGESLRQSLAELTTVPGARRASLNTLSIIEAPMSITDTMALDYMEKL